MDKKIIEMIKDGRIQSVSIGAKVDDLIEEEDGSRKALGIKGLEISLVAVPGDNQASLGQALQDSFVLKEKATLINESPKIADIHINKKGGLIMEEQTQEPVAEETEEVKAEEAPVEEPATEEKVASTTNVNVKVDNSEMSEMRKQITELKELLIAKKKLKEEIESEEPKVEDETVGEVGDEAKEDAEESMKNLNNLIVEKANLGYSIYRDYATESTDTKLKRLIR